MATTRDQIEHIEHNWVDEEKPWKKFSKSRKYLKKQMNKYIRRKGKDISDDDISIKTKRKPYSGWEY